MANIVDFTYDKVEQILGKKSVRGTLTGIVNNKEQSIQFDQVVSLQVGRNCNLTTYSVGDGAVTSDYYSPGQKVVQISGFFSTWQGKSITEELFVPSIMDRDKMMDSFITNKVFLTLDVSYFKYENLMITSYNFTPSNEAYKVDFDIVFGEIKTFTLPKEITND